MKDSEYPGMQCTQGYRVHKDTGYPGIQGTLRYWIVIHKTLQTNQEERVKFNGHYRYDFVILLS